MNAITTNDSRLAALRAMAASIRAELSPIMDADANSTAAREAATEASQAASNKREVVMTVLATLAEAGGWNVKDVDAAAKMACSESIGNEALPKSVATFVGEARRAMHPDVRNILPGLIGLRDAVWNGEKEMRKADKDGAATPLMKAFARSYHALVGMMGAVIDGEATFTGPDDVTAWAEARDPELDPKKQFAKVESLLTVLSQIGNRFPDPDILAAVDTLKTVSADTMKAARAEMQGREDDRMNSHKLAPVPAVVAERVAAAEAPTTVVAESDPLAEVLGEVPDATDNGEETLDAGTADALDKLYA